MGRLSETLGNRVYLDANIIVYAVQGFDAHTELIQELLAEMDSANLVAFTSAITLAEVLVKPKQDQNLGLERAFKDFLQPSHVFDLIPVTEDILETAAGLRATTSLKLPDAIHAATAAAQRATSLLTNDKALKSAPNTNVVILSEIPGT